MRSTRHYLRMNVSNVIVGEYMCQGRMPQSVRERYLKMKDAPDHPANLDVLIQNFDCALSHPDADDLRDSDKPLGTHPSDKTIK